MSVSCIIYIALTKQVLAEAVHHIDEVNIICIGDDTVTPVIDGKYISVTAFTVLFTAWYRPNCIFTCYLSLAVNINNLYNNYYALPCCKQNYYYYYLLL